MIFGLGIAKAVSNKPDVRGPCAGINIVHVLLCGYASVNTLEVAAAFIPEEGSGDTPADSEVIEFYQNFAGKNRDLVVVYLFWVLQSCVLATPDTCSSNSDVFN